VQVLEPARHAQQHFRYHLAPVAERGGQVASEGAEVAAVHERWRGRLGVVDSQEVSHVRASPRQAPGVKERYVN